MLRRLWRMIRALFGFAVDAVESPELILQQNIRDLEDQVPKMNDQLSEILAAKRIAEEELAKIKSKETDLLNKAKSALKANRRDIAQQYAVEMEKLKPTIADKEKGASLAKTAYEKADNAKTIFLREKNKKIDEARAALSRTKQAEWNAKLANTLANFQVGSIDQTQDEMIRRINEDAAKAEAKLQLAIDSKQDGLAAIEEDASKIQADEMLRQLELDMGLSAPSVDRVPDAAPVKDKTIGPDRVRV